MDFYKRKKRAFRLTIDMLKQGKTTDEIAFAAMYRYGISKSTVMKFIEQIEKQSEVKRDKK